MKRMLVRLGLLALVTSALVGCGGGGGSDGIAGAAGSSGSAGVSAVTGALSVAALSATDFSNLAIDTTTSVVTGVGVNSPPVITFTLRDGSGNGITGLENNWSTAAVGDTVRTYRNVAASFAKLVPGTGGSPDQWISYIVTNMPTTGAAAGGVTPTGTETPSGLARPTTDNTGLLEAVTGSPGTYRYTFRRDITTVAAYAAATVDSGNKFKADMGDLSFAKDGTTIYRVAVQISGNARGTGSNTADGVTVSPAVALRNPVDIIYDFTVNAAGTSSAATSTREIVKTAACMSCHNKFTFHGGSALTGVGGSRQDTRMCTVCHTDQRKFDRAEATRTATGFSGSFGKLYGRSPNNLGSFIHTIHMGSHHVLTDVMTSGFSVPLNEIKYPQLITNCTKCHDATPTAATPTGVNYSTAQGDNWKNVPSRMACGGCHIGIDFALGTGTNVDGSTTGHGKGSGLGGIQANDAACVTCHSPAAIATVHIPVSPPSAANVLNTVGASSNTNSAWIAGDATNLPTGAIKVTYDISSVTRNASKNPVMKFRILQNAVRTDFAAYADRVTAGGGLTTDAALSGYEIWDNFMGSPSVYFVWSVAQDGIAAPSDFNASASAYIRSVWNGKTTAATASFVNAATGALSTTPVADASGYYTMALTGTIVPDGAGMLTGGLGYSYSLTTTMPLTQTNLAAYPTAAATAASGLTAYSSNKTGGLIVIAPDASKIASTRCLSSAGATISTWPCTGSSGAYAPRRVIVEDARCNNCHKELGVFNDASFHGGQRNDGPTCSWCHTPNRTSSGWYVDSTDFVHAIHGNLKRSTDAPLSSLDVAGNGRFTWHSLVVEDKAATATTGTAAPDGLYYNTDGSAYATAVLAQAAVTATSLRGKIEDFAEVGYPGVLKNCEACHVAGSYDFSNTTNAGQVANKQYRTLATGFYNGTAGVITKAYSSSTSSCTVESGTTPQTALAVYSLSPYITKDNATNYGQGFSYNASTSASGSKVCSNDGVNMTTLPAATIGASMATQTYPNDANSYSAYSKTLVNSPIATVCVSCHLAATTWSHIRANGGALWATRATVFGTSTAMPTAPVTGEQCMVCHDSGGIADIKVMHSR